MSEPLDDPEVSRFGAQNVKISVNALVFCIFMLAKDYIFVRILWVEYAKAGTVEVGAEFA